MRFRALQISASLALACLSLDYMATAAGRVASTEGKAAFVFGGVDYFHRWSENDQHEFTPTSQGSLEKWTDMITINVYPSAHDGDALAVKANAVLENYKSHGGRVLRTDSVPRTPDRPAEHFVAVVFGRPNFLEAAFARFKLVEGIGCSIVYSHRIYGEKVGDQMSKWLTDNGPKMEKALMEWNNIPSPASLRQLPRNADGGRQFPDPNLAANGVRLAIAALAAIACLAVIHRAIFAGRFARGLVSRQRSCANHGCDYGTDNFGELLHTDLNFPQR